MEFAEWVVSGLDQLRLGQLPAGNDFYTVASDGLGGDPRLPAYMNSGDPEARAELVELITATVAANPGFEQQLRDAAAVAAPAPGSADGKPPFLKTTNGLLAIAAAVVVVVGGGIGLALGLSGSSSGDLAAMLKGTWVCQPSGTAASDTGVGPLSFTVGDGTWTAGTASGTWKQSGRTATLHDANDPKDDVKASNLPTGSGSFDVTLGSASDSSPADQIHVKGTVSAHKITVALLGDDGDLDLTCAK